MAIVELSKKRVIEILRKEKLTQGTFAFPGRGRNDSETPANKQGCTFCAVGQIVRACMAATVPVADVWNRALSAARLRSAPTPLRSLEKEFEHATNAEAGRRAAIAWAREHLPAHVRLDISNAKPRRGVKVVG